MIYGNVIQLLHLLATLVFPMKVRALNYHSTTFFSSITATINPRKAIKPLLWHQTIHTRAKSHTPTAQTTLPQHTPAHNQLAGWS